MVELKQFDKALETAKQMIKIKPENPESYVSAGMISEETGDTINSLKYFNNALVKYDNILDTMSKENKMYKILLMNKAVDLIFARQQTKGNEILKQLYDYEKDEIFKEMINDYRNKSTKEIINNIFNPKSSISYPQ